MHRKVLNLGPFLHEEFRLSTNGVNAKQDTAGRVNYHGAIVEIKRLGPEFVYAVVNLQVHVKKSFVFLRYNSEAAEANRFGHLDTFFARAVDEAVQVCAPDGNFLAVGAQTQAV